MTIAIAAASMLLVRLSSQIVFAQVEQNAGYLILPDLPILPLPPATSASNVEIASSTMIGVRQLAVAAPTPMPTPTPRPALPLRIEIPSIKLDSPVVESRLIVAEDNNDGLFWEWDVPTRAVGYHGDSAAPGGGKNTVLSGHNNTKGQVFRRLAEVKVGDTIMVHTAVRQHRYRIIEKTIIPYWRDRSAAEEKLYAYMAEYGSERLTLLSCHPYPLNYDRIVVVAEPVKRGDDDDPEQ
ncbi:MAG: sortase [Caldilineaceae bacterium]|nr:sortase [Caldilineaceae bacterium]